jgi:hypothetical protein
MPSKPTFRIHIPSGTQENVSPAPPTVTTFALPGSAAENLIRMAPVPKAQTGYNIMKSRLSTWNLNRPIPEADCDEGTTSYGYDLASDAMPLDIAREWEGSIAINEVDRDSWMEIETPGPFPL